jgi:hypothetical protein
VKRKFNASNTGFPHTKNQLFNTREGSMNYRQLLVFASFVLIQGCSSERAQVSFHQNIDLTNDTIQFTCKVTGSYEDFLTVLEDCNNKVSESITRIRQEGIFNIPDLSSSIFSAQHSGEFYNNLDKSSQISTAYEFKTGQIPITKNY